MNKSKLIDPFSFVFAGIVLLFGFLLFYSQTSLLLGSMAAAILASCLSWVSYVLMRWLILSLRK